MRLRSRSPGRWCVDTSPKSITAASVPAPTRVFAGWRSPCIHTGGPGHGGRGHGVVPNRPDGVGIHFVTEGCQPILEGVRPVRQRHPPKRVVGRIRRRRAVQGTQKQTETPGPVVRVGKRRLVAGAALEPGNDRPGPRIDAGRLADPDGSRYRQRHQPRQLRQPPLLVGSQAGCHGPPRQTDQQVAPELPHAVVPSAPDF